MTHRTLVIPDIHHKYHIAEQIISKERPDLTIFLGDYFDDFYDTADDVANTAKWLKGSLDSTCTENDNKTSNCRIHLIGNHDLHYMTMNQKFTCRGHSRLKHNIIDTFDIDWSKLRLYYWLGDTDDMSDRWLCTHAGFTNKLFVKYLKTGSETVNDILQRADEDLDNIHNESVEHTFLQAGTIRGGPENSVGGIIWCDYNEFVDIPNTKQIFGHTRDFKVRHKITSAINSEHYCIDTTLCNYAICDDYNTMTIKNVE